MRPRPFKYFFGVAVAVMLLFFVARVFFAAFVFAAIASTIYFLLRSVGNFFRNLNWQADSYGQERAYAREMNANNHWNTNKAETLFDATNRSFEHFKKQESVIRIR